MVWVSTRISFLSCTICSLILSPARRAPVKALSKVAFVRVFLFTSFSPSINDKVCGEISIASFVVQLTLKSVYHEYLLTRIKIQLLLLDHLIQRKDNLNYTFRYTSLVTVDHHHYFHLLRISQ